MTWALIAAMLVVVVGLLVFALRLPRAGFEALGAALLLALAGYAWQGHPAQAGQPRTPDEPVASDPATQIAVRQALADPGKPGMDGGNTWLITADALLRHGQFADAAAVLDVAVKRNPKDSDAWLGLGNALMGHAQGQISPAALLAYRQAMAADPTAPGPPFFLGVAYAQQGHFDMARSLWTSLLARAPANAPWRPQVVAALVRLERISTIERAAGRLQQ